MSDHPARGEAVRPLVRSNSVPARSLGPEGNNAVRESRAMISGNLAQRKTSMVQKVSHVVETKPKNVLTVEEFYGVVRHVYNLRQLKLYGYSDADQLARRKNWNTSIPPPYIQWWKFMF